MSDWQAIEGVRRKLGVGPSVDIRGYLLKNYGDGVIAESNEQLALTLAISEFCDRHGTTKGELRKLGLSPESTAPVVERSHAAQPVSERRKPARTEAEALARTESDLLARSVDVRKAMGR